AVVGLDSADEPKAITGKMLLRGLDHGVDRVVALAAPMRVDIRSILGPGLGDEVAASLVVPLVPRRQIIDDQLVDVRHGMLLPFECLLLASLPNVERRARAGDYLRGHIRTLVASLAVNRSTDLDTVAAGREKRATSSRRMRTHIKKIGSGYS